MTTPRYTIEHFHFRSGAKQRIVRDASPDIFGAHNGYSDADRDQVAKMSTGTSLYLFNRRQMVTMQ